MDGVSYMPEVYKLPMVRIAGRAADEQLGVQVYKNVAEMPEP